LAHCDVLVLKTPRRPYSDNEIESIVKFVDNGGGLLLVGEHTDVYATGRNLNAVARCFGFQFRYDCLFGMDSVFDQRYELPLVPHPILQGMPGLDFATSCSIAPRDWSGRAAIRSTGLKNLVADYHVNNFYPQPFDRADMRYGAFVQLWTASYGAGRVAAFADSTIFSNFSACEPGKAELWLGMLEWLNHRDEGARGKRWWAGGLGLALLIAAAALGFGWPGAWLVLLTAGLAGWAVGVAGVRFAHAQGMPLPEQQRPLVQVVMDRTVSSGKLPKGGFIAGKPYEFGIFERWILRLGYFYARRGGHQVFENSDLAIFLRPNKSPSARFVEQLEAYVAAGGKVLVIEAPPRKDAPVEDAPVEDDPNAEKDPTAAAPSTANELLAPFGLKVGEEPLGKGKLRVPGGWPAVDVPEAVAVEGGTPLAVLNGRTVAASVRHGEGLVTAIGFGDRFSDAHMGVTGDVVPDETLRQVYELQFSLLRAMIEAGQLPRAE
jgi:hypothetical protein